MRYMAMSVFGVALALVLSNGSVRGNDVHVEAGVRLNGGDLDISVFNDQLAPHGKWMDVAEFGHVWQPNECVTDTEWRPYLNNGHWIWTDGGWYWESSYAWGWAAFHYGRWNHVDKYNWVWSPDVAWAPAWVSWRQSDSVYGWAPLPFGSRFEGGAFIGAGIDVHAEFFNFVPAQSFLALNLSTVAIPRAQAVNVYKETKIVNNSYAVNDNRVVNNGIPVKQVAGATKQEIKPTKITDAKAPAEKGEAGQVAAYRPAIKQAPAATTAKPADTNPKAVEPKPIETAVKPNEAKEAKPADPRAKPADLKPEEPKTRAVEPKASEAKPADTKAKPADVKPDEPKAKAVESKASEAKPVETKAKPVDAKPEEPKATPAESKAKPEEPKAKPEEPKAKPEEPKAKPD